MSHRHRHHAAHGRGGRHRQRARRGAVRLAVLELLDERPMHGYELITELEERSGGRWRPSPGSMYPALNHLEEVGIVDAAETDGKRQYTLTDRGREVLAELRAGREADAPAPWEDHGPGRRSDMRRLVSELVAQARQVGRYGSPGQVERAETILGETIRQLYAVLATPDDTTTTGDEDT